MFKANKENKEVPPEPEKDGRKANFFERKRFLDYGADDPDSSEKKPEPKDSKKKPALEDDDQWDLDLNKKDPKN